MCALGIFHDAKLVKSTRPRFYFYNLTFIYLSLQNAVGKMRSLALVLASCFNLLQIVVHSQELSIIRHSDGDIFTIEGKYVCIL